jgi:hypothetical protein
MNFVSIGNRAQIRVQQTCSLRPQTPHMAKIRRLEFIGATGRSQDHKCNSGRRMQLTLAWAGFEGTTHFSLSGAEWLGVKRRSIDAYPRHPF